ncbi:hypothetical protein AJ87_02105 [Rhizobium yanglingense]|nr:hypothetical protein AJ87_02105 [Rhizobium yanglingense]
MMGTIETGTGKSAKIPGWQAAGKTGTTQNSRDALFVGFTSNLTTGVWFGNDDGTPMKKVTGGGLPAKAWQEFMIAAHKGLSPAPLFGNGQFIADPNGFAISRWRRLNRSRCRSSRQRSAASFPAFSEVGAARRRKHRFHRHPVSSNRPWPSREDRFHREMSAALRPPLPSSRAAPRCLT